MGNQTTSSKHFTPSTLCRLKTKIIPHGPWARPAHAVEVAHEDQIPGAAIHDEMTVLSKDVIVPKLRLSARTHDQEQTPHQSAVRFLKPSACAAMVPPSSVLVATTGSAMRGRRESPHRTIDAHVRTLTYLGDLSAF